MMHRVALHTGAWHHALHGQFNFDTANGKFYLAHATADTALYAMVTRRCHTQSYGRVFLFFP
jgi:hypothetical protein